MSLLSSNNSYSGAGSGGGGSGSSDEAADVEARLARWSAAGVHCSASLSADYAAALARLHTLASDAQPDAVLTSEFVAYVEGMGALLARVSALEDAECMDIAAAIVTAAEQRDVLRRYAAADPDCVRVFTALISRIMLYAAHVAVINFLSQAHDSLVALLLPFEGDFSFWRERVEWGTRHGALLARVWDALEAGPVEWAHAAVIAVKRWVRHAPSLPYDASSPIAKMETLATLRAPLMHMLGLVKHALATARMATTPAQWQAAMQQSVVIIRTCWVLPAAAAATTAATTAAPASSALPGTPSVASASAATAAALPAGSGADISAPAIASLVATAALELTQLRGRMAEQTAHLHRRSYAQRHWMRWTLLATGAVAGTYYAATHREELAAAAQGARASIVEFYVEHLQIPLQQMSSELFGGKRAQVADAAALVESKRDLVAMLQHYYGRIGSSAALRTSLSSDLQAADLARLAAAMDMRGVGERFVIEVRQPISNAVRGDLVELMLIQIAYIKKELLAAMAAMDQILRDNQFNFQVSAMIPAFMVLYASSSLLFSALRIASEPRDTTQLIFTFRLILRDVHRLLTLSQPARATAAVARALQMEPNAPPLTALLAPLWSSAQLHAQVCTAVSKSQSAGGLSFATLSNMAAPIAHFAALHEAVQRFVGGRCGADMNAPTASSSSSPAPATASTSAPALGGMPASERPGRASVGEASGRSASPASPPTSSPTQHALAFFPTSAHGPANASPVSFVGEHVALTPVVSPIETGASPSPSLLLPEVTYTGLPPQQLGELAVLLFRLAQLLSQLRRSMPFAEWSRMSQDLADLSSPQLSEPQRVQTVQRLQTSYSAISLPASTAATTSFLLSGASLPL